MAVPGGAYAAQYVVAPSGNDAHAGTSAQPFRTLQHAADVMQPGDTCVIRAGVYRETVRPKLSGEPGRPLRFVAAPGATVTVSGADVLSPKWSVYRGSIYQGVTHKHFVQLFVNGRMMPEARWPNSPLDDVMAMKRAKAGPGTDFDTLADPNLPPGNWNGAVVLIWPGARWTSATRRITDYVPGRSLRFDRSLKPKRADTYNGEGAHRPQAGNPYVLIGSLAGLDSPGEWFLDAAKGLVYLWPPRGGSPAAATVEVKQRDLAFDLSKRSYVELHGLHIFAAALNLTGAHHCLVEDCSLRYVDHCLEFPEGGGPPEYNVVTGSDNELRHCSLGYAAGTLLRLAGDNNRLVDSVAFDGDYLGSGQGALNLSQSVGASVMHCTVCCAGRDIITHFGSKRIRLEYDDLYGANMLNNDAGAIYCWGTNGEGGIIAYNWVHDDLGDATCGIYLDNFSSHFFVHHNVVWNNSASGIRLNCDSLDNLVCNNTLERNREAFGTFTYSGHVPTQKGTQIVNNNVIEQMRADDPAEFVQGKLAPEISHNAACAVDRRGVPTPGSAAIDAGIVIAGITDGYRGKAPDLGAYEYGGKYWVPGADWRDPDMPAEPPHDLSFTPRGPVDEHHMVTQGLVLWLDASDRKTVETDAAGRVRVWRDKSGHGHDATPRDPAHLLAYRANAINGKPAVAGTGQGSLRVGRIRAGQGAFTVFIVSQAENAGGPSWQRLMGSSCGQGDEWVQPNWIIMRPGGEKPAAYKAQVFSEMRRRGFVLDQITLFGPPGPAAQFLTADIGEVLLYDRALPFDETDAIEAYLKAKWGLK